MWRGYKLRCTPDVCPPEGESLVALGSPGHGKGDPSESRKLHVEGQATLWGGHGL